MYTKFANFVRQYLPQFETVPHEKLCNFTSLVKSLSHCFAYFFPTKMEIYFIAESQIKHYLINILIKEIPNGLYKFDSKM